MSQHAAVSPSVAYLSCQPSARLTTNGPCKMRIDAVLETTLKQEYQEHGLTCVEGWGKFEAYKVGNHAMLVPSVNESAGPQVLAPKCWPLSLGPKFHLAERLLEFGISCWMPREL